MQLQMQVQRGHGIIGGRSINGIIDSKMPHQRYGHRHGHGQLSLPSVSPLRLRLRFGVEAASHSLSQSQAQSNFGFGRFRFELGAGRRLNREKVRGDAPPPARATSDRSLDLDVNLNLNLNLQDRNGNVNGIRDNIALGLMFASWNLFNIYFNIYNKQVLKVYPFPMTVTAVQFGIGSVLILLMWALNLHQRPKISSLSQVLTRLIPHLA